MDKHRLFIAYNAARRMANQGILEIGRVNRALGICLRNAFDNDYDSSIDDCHCPDHEMRLKRLQPCKHRVAWALKAFVEAQA